MGRERGREPALADLVGFGKREVRVLSRRVIYLNFKEMPLNAIGPLTGWDPVSGVLGLPGTTCLQTAISEAKLNQVTLPSNVVL